MTRTYNRGTVEERFWARVKQTTSGCWIWDGHCAPYGRLGVPGKGVLLAHRVSWEVHFGPIPTGLWVLHHCDNPPCCNPAHLFLGTSDDNIADMRAKGRGTDPPHVFGETHPRAKVTAAQVAEIRRRYVPRKVTRRMLATEYGVSVAAVKAIVQGQNWRDITDVRTPVSL